jgi:hypothetical protein
VNVVSYDYTPEPRRAEVTLPADFDPQALQDIADYLTGKRDSI